MKKSSTRHIVLIPFDHRGSAKLKLQFDYDVRLKDHVKLLYGVKWSQTHRTFYMPATDGQVSALLTHIKGRGIWVDQQLWMSHDKGTETDNIQSVVKKSVPISLNKEIKQKIVEYEQWMKQKRYSPATIQTYVSMVKQFFNRTDITDWKSMTSKNIEAYNYTEYIVKKRSYSTQNQFINAIKLFNKINGLAIHSLNEIERPRKSHHLPDVLSVDEVKGLLEQTSNLKHRT